MEGQYGGTNHHHGDMVDPTKQADRTELGLITNLRINTAALIITVIWLNLLSRQIEVRLAYYPSGRST